MRNELAIPMSRALLRALQIPTASEGDFATMKGI
jgi:hypothetical protein